MLAIKVSWNPFHPDWIALATNNRFGTGNSNNPTPGPHKWKRAKTIEVSGEGKPATMRFEGGDTFTMKTEGEATTTGYPTLREAIPRTFPTLVRD